MAKVPTAPEMARALQAAGGVMGGMIAATVLAVFLVPVFFVVIRRIFPSKARHLEGDKHE